MAPHTVAPTQMAMGISACWETPNAIGASAVMVPMDVPIEREMKQPMTKIPATIY